jgi:hypothetical protein
MKHIIYIVIICFFCNHTIAQVEVNTLKQHITFLADDKLEGRQTGSKGEQLAYEYLIKQYKLLNLYAVGDSGSYLQSFAFNPKADPHGSKSNENKNGEKKIGHNVLAYLDNHAANTIVIGAHYDHLGYGEYGSSLNTEKKPQIHNGADDNASGTAGVLELARILTSAQFRGHNYLFAHFSGEELGLFGSKYMVEHLPTGIAPIMCMINMDMIGRLNTAKSIEVGGTGTSPIWDKLLDANPTNAFQIKKSKSGVGPSDHTSFYLKGIPVLFFFTGSHSDYHKPTDDVEKINFEGEQLILNYLMTLLLELDHKPTMEFTKTKDEDNKLNTSFKVTLGIMPDYTFDGKGIRADGVTEGRPAFKAGLLAGDIIIKLGKYKTSSMQKYMVALGKFEKGNCTKVTILRNNKKINLPITF